MFRSVDELADHEGITTLHRCGQRPGVPRRTQGARAQRVL